MTQRFSLTSLKTRSLGITAVLRQAWREEVASQEERKMQITVGLSCLLITISVGYLYVHDINVQGWQLGTWGMSVLVAAAVLFSARDFPKTKLSEWKWLTLLFVVALLLRVVLLEMIPGLLHVDEIGSADFPMRHVFPAPGRTINPFRTATASQPALYAYLQWAAIHLLGYSIQTIRLSSAVAGTLAVLVTFATVMMWQDKVTAWITAVLMTTYHYHIHWSRIALNNIWDTLWVPLALAAFTWGWRKQWSGGAVVAGLAMGLGQYFYAGNKIGLFLLLFLFVQLYREKRDWRQWVIFVGKFGVTFVTVAAPIALFALLEPEVYFDRSQMVMGWTAVEIEQITRGGTVWQYLGHQLWYNWGAFTSVSEVTGFYGPNVPFLIGLASTLFMIGFVWSLWQRQWLPVLWLTCVVLFGGILLNGSPSSSHYVASIPVICWLTAVPLGWLWQHKQKHLVVLLLLFIVLTDLYFYFGVYVPGHPHDLIHPLPPMP